MVFSAPPDLEANAREAGRQINPPIRPRRQTQTFYFIFSWIRWFVLSLLHLTTTLRKKRVVAVAWEAMAASCLYNSLLLQKSVHLLLHHGVGVELSFSHASLSAIHDSQATKCPNKALTCVFA